MKLPKEFVNGILIFMNIGLFFLLMDFLGLADIFYLRLLNVAFLFYGVNRTIQMNIAEGKKKFIENVISSMVTSIIGVVFCVLGLLIYSQMMGGDLYVQSLSKTFLFGGNPTVNTYVICLLFEGIASSVIVTLLLMLYWNDRLATE